MTETCPQCSGSRIKRAGQPAQNIVTGIRNNFVYFNVCLSCGFRWDGVTETEHGIVPPGIEAREVSENE